MSVTCSSHCNKVFAVIYVWWHRIRYTITCVQSYLATAQSDIYLEPLLLSRAEPAIARVTRYTAAIMWLITHRHPAYMHCILRTYTEPGSRPNYRHPSSVSHPIPPYRWKMGFRCLRDEKVARGDNQLTPLIAVDNNPLALHNNHIFSVHEYMSQYKSLRWIHHSCVIWLRLYIISH